MEIILNRGGKKNMKNKKIAFDLDGVVYDFMGPLDKFATLSMHPLVDRYSYSLQKRYNITDKQRNSLLESFGETRPFKWMPLYDKAKEEMIRLSKDNELYIVTHRDWTNYGIEDTLERIKKDELPVNPDNIIFSKDKGLHANEIGIYLFYEDVFENAIDILEKSISLVRLVDTSYNEKYSKKIKRVKW